jgi:ribosomal protein S18 acetylase RimI-like enzyme
MSVTKRVVTKNYTVRQYCCEDYPSVISIWSETNLGNPVRGDDQKTIEDSILIGGQLLVIEEIKTSKICGTSWMTFDGRRIHLHHFGILPAYQGKGLGNLLLEESLKFIRAKNYQVKLEVHSTNTAAINLYRKYGFEYLGDYDVYIIRDLNKI